MLKGKLAINETDPQMFAYFLVADNLKCIIGKLNHIILSIIIFAYILKQNLCLKTVRKQMLF